MADFEFSWKYKDFEIRTTHTYGKVQTPYVELIKWDGGEGGKRYCFTLAYWRRGKDGDWELLWVVNPAHPIARGIGRFIRLEHEETYGEPFTVPEPDELVFIGTYEGGEVFRSGCCWRKENGKVFYFQPGHETVPTYEHPEILRVIRNAIDWAAPTYRVPELVCPHVKKPLEA